MTAKRLLEFEVSAQSGRRLCEALIHLVLPAEGPPDSFIAEATERVKNNLPKPVAAALANMRTHPDPASCIVVHGLPEDPDLPPTPVVDSGVETKETFISESLIVGFLGQLSDQHLGYRKERPELVANITPRIGREDAETNQGSRKPLGFHTEQAGERDDRRPRYVALIGLRPDHKGLAQTGVADIRDAAERLDADTVSTLRKNGYQFRLPLLHGDDAYSDAAPILTGPAFCPRARASFYGNIMRSTDVRYEEAALRLHAALVDVHHALRIVPGTLAIIDNSLALHARLTGFVPRYDGRDRWIQRVLAGDLFAHRERVREHGRVF